MRLGDRRLRTTVKAALARTAPSRPAAGVTVLIYHRVGGGSGDELDVEVASFERHLQILEDHQVVGLDTALDGLAAGERTPRVVLTFDDGFEEVYRHAWPLLRERRMPFTVYLASAYVGAPMRWEGSTANADDTRGMRWEQLCEMAADGLCSVENHTHSHLRPQVLTVEDIDRCSDEIETHLGRRPRHFAYPWGVPVPRLDDALRDRFRSAATGRVGRNLPGVEPMRLRRVPVRRTDPQAFFEAKLQGRLLPERAYAGIVATAKRLGVSA